MFNPETELTIERAEAMLAALEREKAGYEIAGKKERAKQVGEQIAWCENLLGRKPKPKAASKPKDDAKDSGDGKDGGEGGDGGAPADA